MSDLREGRSITAGALLVQALTTTEALPSTAQAVSGSLLPFGNALSPAGAIYVRFV